MLIEIPLIEGSRNWPIEVAEAEGDRLHAILDNAYGMFSRPALKLTDTLTRRWLGKSENPYIGEISRIDQRVGAPGIYTLNLANEWACLVGVGQSASGQGAGLVRILDHRIASLGQQLVAIRISSVAGPWISITWPGFVGVVQASAPGRFAASMNRPPPNGLSARRWLGWPLNCLKVWSQTALPPEHLLRRVFETARSFDEALKLLKDTPIATPAIFALAGMRQEQACIIERQEHDAVVYEGPGSASMDWRTPGWGRSDRRKSPIAELRPTAVKEARDPFAWVQPPLCNKRTRLAVVAEPATGLLMAQGYDGPHPVTKVLETKQAQA